MAKVIYTPKGDNPGPVTWMGVTFRPNVATDVDKPALLEAIKVNPFFKVEGGSELEATGPERAALEADARELGIVVDSRWSDKKLSDKIQTALAQ